MNRLVKYMFNWANLCLFFYCSSIMAAPIKYEFNYLKLIKKQVATFTNLNKQPEDSGYQGAKLAIEDSNTTGKFLQQKFILHYFEFEAPQALLDKIKARYAIGEYIFFLDVPENLLIKADVWAQGKGVLLFNVSESADALRYKHCLKSVLHTIPSNAMKSDALAQWLVTRRLQDILLIKGMSSEDEAIATSFKRSVKRFGLTVMGEKTWDFDTDLRRSTQQEIPLFTQTTSSYDVVYVADKYKDFSEFLPFNTYLPRPVVGGAGLEALAWHRVIEQWGAAQLQTRFTKLSSRDMNEVDFSGYLAVRSVAQATQNVRSNDGAKIIEFIRSPDFELAAYKGRKLSYRAWNGQLRMPIALVQPNAFVSQSPQEGMLHPQTELDTLGFDVQEMQCN
ncbi:MAG: ABC transporter substrate binding protein (PQQ-dependent alcohol dehydrogenase system) [Paraglaciecola sp.]|jgi:ABC transporter substrate binding protein (PQQ-dependent alcohol dehydrogenase system)